MILAIILLVLIILLVALLILFSFEILLPSIHLDEKNDDDPLLPKKNKTFLIPEYKVFEKTDKRAIVMCSCKKKTTLKQTDFNEQFSCYMVKNNYGTGLDCKFACIGLGDCAKICPQQAIFIENKTAVISNLCCGCGKCIEVCPQQIIKLVPKDTKSIILCNNNQEKSLTSCDKKQIEEKVSWNDKKDFKIWTHCYRLLNKLLKK